MAQGPSLNVKMGADTRALDRALVQSADLFTKFDKVVADTGGKLRSSLSNFSGEKVITQAHAMTRAYQQLADQGINLTAKEQKKLNAVVTEAIAKYDALGREAPADLQKVAAATRQTESGFAKLGGIVKSTFGQFLGAMTVQSVVGGLVSTIDSAAREAVDFGGKIVDLSNKTGISRRALQEFSYVADQTGSSLDALTGATFKLQANLGKGGKDVEAALKGIGLSLETLRGQSPDEQFATVARALGQVKDQTEFARTGIVLFGKSFGEIAPTIREGFADLVEEARRLGIILNDDVINSLERWGDVQKRLQVEMRTRAAEHADAIYAVKTAWQELQIVVVETLARIAKSPWAFAKMGIKGGLGLGAEPTVTPGLIPEPPMGPFDTETTTKRAAQAERDLAEERRKGAEAARRFKEIEAAHAESLARLLRMMPATPNTFVQPGSLFSPTVQGFVAPGGMVGGETPGGFGGWSGDLFGVGGFAAGKTPSWAAGLQGGGQGLLPSRAISTGLVGAPTATAAKKPGAGFWGSAFGSPQAFGANLSSTVVGAFMGGGNVGAAVGSSMAGSIASSLGGSLASKLGGGTIGKMLGGALGPLGSMLGGLGGELLGKLFGKLFGSEAKETKKMRDQWLAQAGGIDQVRKMAEYAGVSIDKLLSTKKTKEFEKQVKALEAAFKATQERVQKLTSDLGALAQRGGLMSGDLLGRLTKDLDKPEVQDAFRGFVSTNLDSAARGLQSFIEAGRDLPLTQRSASALGDALAGIVGRMRELGGSLPDILSSLGPTIQALQDRLGQAGFGGGEAFDQLAATAALAADQVAGPLLSGIDGISQALTGLANTGLLTESMFGGLTEQVGAAYQRIVEGGASGDAAIRAMGPSLQRIWELQQQYGYEVDATTQGLIDEAQAQGIVGEQMKSTQDQILTVLRLIAKALGADIPEAADTAAQAIKDRLSNIKVPKVRVPWELENGGPGGEGGGSTAHTGALVLAQGLRKFHGGGLASDETMAVLQTGEAVLSRAAVRRLGASTISKINRGETAGGFAAAATQTIQVLLDGRVLTDVVARRLPGAMRAYGVA